MNERINELWEQCKTINWSIDNPEYDHEKFAELIIRKCAFIVEDAVDHREPASTYVDKIKQHFGIEVPPKNIRVIKI